MTNIFSNKKSAEATVEQDFVGGGLLDSDIYAAKLKAAYQSNSASSKAVAINFVFDVNGKEVNEQIWVTNGQGGITYKDKRSGEERNLPGFNQVNSLCMLLTGKSLGEQNVEDRVVKIYDFDAKKQIPKSVPCFVDLHDLDVDIAIQKHVIDKTEKNASTGTYEPTGETREVNKVVKFFSGNRVTISEVAQFIGDMGSDIDSVKGNGELLRAVSKTPAGEFAPKWLENNKGKVINKSKGAAGEGKSLATIGTAKTTKTASLFDE